MTLDLIRAAAAGTAAAVVMHIFFHAVQARWPEQYSTARSVADSYSRRGLIRYLTSRYLPVYLVGVFLSVTARRLGLNVALAVCVTTGFHLASTNGWAIFRLVQRRRDETRTASLALYYTVTGALVVVAAVVAYRTFVFWDSGIPVPRDVVLALWTGLIAAVLAAYIQSLRLPQSFESQTLSRARQDIGEGSWRYAEHAARRHNADPDLIRAIIVAEVLQRPAWFRRLEHLKGLVVPRGSYGVAQIGSDRPLIDEQSIEALAASLADYYPERTEKGYVKWERVAARIEQHNQSAAFVESVRSMYSSLQPYAAYHSATLAQDRRPTIEVNEVNRVRQSWELRGTASVYEGNLQYTAQGNAGETDCGLLQVSAGGPPGERGSSKCLLGSATVAIRGDHGDRGRGRQGLAYRLR